MFLLRAKKTLFFSLGHGLIRIDPPGPTRFTPLLLSEGIAGGKKLVMETFLTGFLMIFTNSILPKGFFWCFVPMLRFDSRFYQFQSPRILRISTNISLTEIGPKEPWQCELSPPLHWPPIPRRRRFPCPSSGGRSRCALPCNARPSMD